MKLKIKPSCFGTTEYATTSNICKKCIFVKRCGNIKNKKRKDKRGVR